MRQAILEKLKGGIIASVQASAGEPLNRPEILEAMALSCLDGGAVALRMANTETEDPIGYFKARHPEVTVIGLTKPDHIPCDAYEWVYITPGLVDIEALVKAQSDIVVLDATGRHQGAKDPLENIVSAVRKRYPDLPLMADIASCEQGQKAADLGFDCIGTTLSGYTAETRENLAAKSNEPDFELLSALVKNVSVPEILEGRTRPHHITRRFVEALS